MSTIRIAAALVVEKNGETLLVRKRGTGIFMQPGGKIEPGENPLQALVRELKEEIGLDIDPETALFLGRFEAAAANEPDHVVEAEMFRVDVDSHVILPTAEIEEARWISVREPTDIPMAPLTEHLVLPFYRQTLSAGEVQE
jgi:8-oxo-dGTP pyrophosphatase MutT (NUDIX family)